jgi:hypothetical protein
VRISADSNLLPVLDINLHHGRLLSHNVHDSQDDLEDIFSGKLLAGLEALDHILNKLQSHLVSQLCAVVGRIHCHVLDV